MRIVYERAGGNQFYSDDWLEEEFLEGEYSLGEEEEFLRTVAESAPQFGESGDFRVAKIFSEVAVEAAEGRVSAPEGEVNWGHSWKEIKNGIVSFKVSRSEWWDFCNWKDPSDWDRVTVTIKG